MKKIVWLTIVAVALGWIVVHRGEAADVFSQQVAPTAPPERTSYPSDGKVKVFKSQYQRPDPTVEQKGSVDQRGDTLLPPPLQGLPPQTKAQQSELDEKKSETPKTQAFAERIPLPPPPSLVDPDLLWSAECAGTSTSPTIVKLEPRLGFYFIRPFWSKRDFSIGVPRGDGGSGVILADTRDVANDYIVGPVIDIRVEFDELNLTFAGVEYAFASSLNQAVNSGTGNASLYGTSSLTLRQATVAKVDLDLTVPELLKGCFKDGKFKFGFGPYYLYVDQDYNATLVSGNNKATLHSHQNFEGLGLVSSVVMRTAQCQIKSSNWYYNFYNGMTGAIVLGQNNRLSDFSVTGGVNPSVFNNASDFVPLGTLELAFEFEKKEAFRLAGSHADHGNVDANFRVGCMAQVIGGVGMPSAQSRDSRALENGSLYLVGFGATFGLSY